MTDATRCFHCGGRLNDKPIAAKIDGHSRSVCSTDCANVVTRIAAIGLNDFYKFREEPAPADRASNKAPRSWATYERPALKKEFVSVLSNGHEVAEILIHGVHCAACTWLIETTLQKKPGTISVEVNPITTRAEITYNPDRVTLSALLSEIAKLGFTPIPFTEHHVQQAAEKEFRTAMRRLLVAGLGMMQVVSYAVAMYAGAFQGMDESMLEFFRLISLIVATPVVLYSGAPFFSGAWRNLRARALNMDVPVALAIGAAWLASVWNTFAGSGDVFFDSATMFVFFLSGTRLLEAAARHRALDLTKTLAQQIPSTAIRLTAAGHEEIAVIELELGDTVLVAQGNTFPADGQLQGSRTQVDESMLTGESTAVPKLAGDEIIAGSINVGSTAQMRVDKIGADTVLAQIGRLVANASSEKPALIQLTDRIASFFVLTVLAVATITGLVWWQIDASRTFEIVLTVLVVTCPCALALATPAAFTVATSKLAKQGFLIRRGNAIPTLARVQHVVADKTGTLTDSTLTIAEVETYGQTDARSARRIAAALEVHSTHPIARAFRSESEAEIAVAPATDVDNVVSRGLEGTIDGIRYRLGSLDYVSGFAEVPQSDSSAPEPDRRDVYLVRDDTPLARFALTEHLRAGAPATVHALKQLGIEVTIASGDRAAAVAACARNVGANGWRADLLPEDKLALLRELREAGNIVAAIGDGLNDSPVLAGADVSIAMGTGTSVAQHSANCVWLGQQLAGLEDAFVMARKTMGIVKQNLGWALAYNTLAIPLAVGGWIAPWMAALGMSLSSLLVMLNALRLARSPASTAITAQSSQECCSGAPEPAT